MSNIIENIEEDLIVSKMIRSDLTEKRELWHWDLSGRKLYIDKVDKSTSDIIRMITEGELILQSLIIRENLFGMKDTISVYELLLTLILSIFLAENDDDTWSNRWSTKIN